MILLDVAVFEVQLLPLVDLVFVILDHFVRIFQLFLDDVSFYLR